MTTMFTLVVAGLALGQAADDQKSIQGTWKIVALIEDGKSLSEKEILGDYAADGLLVVEGNTASLMPPGAAERRKLVFIIDARATPKAIDLAGGKKVNSKGIYSLTGDSLVICLGTAKAPNRPTGFTASSGSNQIMMALQRVKAAATPKPARPAARPGDERIKKLLVGTWGHSTDSTKNYVTFNADGTFSALVEYTRGARRVFDPTVRSSGTWRLADGVVVVTFTASTESSRRGQIYSFRVTNVSERDLFVVGQDGTPRREWRVR